MSNELYYSTSKKKYIKIAEMPDQHVRYAFIKMNKEKMNGCDIESTLEEIKNDIQDLLNNIYKARKVDEAD
jgi:hypothetical protein